MRRLVVSISLVVLAGTALLPAAAGANPPDNATWVSLACDRGVGSTATLTLQASATDPASLAEVTISCGPDLWSGRNRNRVSIPTGAVAAGYVTISHWTVTGTADDCVSAGPIAFKGACPTSTAGADLVIR